MLERVYRKKQWQTSPNLFSGHKKALSQQRYGVETMGGILARNEDYASVPQGKAKAIFVCGNRAGGVACSHMITFLDDGSQLRGRRSEAMSTLEKRALESSMELVVVDCDIHGGLPFPSTEAITEELQHRHILGPY